MVALVEMANRQPFGSRPNSTDSAAPARWLTTELPVNALSDRQVAGANV
jgi:hypothetical protein